MLALPLLAALLAAEPPLLPVEGEPIAAVAVQLPPPASPEDTARLARYVELKAGDGFRADLVRHAIELMFATGQFADVRVDGERGPAGLTLVFRPVPAPLLARVRVTGDRVVKPEEVARQARLVPHEPLWPARLEGAARDVAVALTALGWLEARVVATTEAAADGVDAVFAIEAGPRVRVSDDHVTGAPPALERELLGLARPRAGAVFRRPQVQAAATRMAHALAAHGFARATVAATEAYDPRRARVALTFAAAPGAHWELAIEGPAVSPRLQQQLADLLREGRYEPDVVEQTAERLEDEFRARGHRDVVVAHETDASGARAVLRYRVAAGPLYSVASVSVAGAPADMSPLLVTQPGEPLQESHLAVDTLALVRALQERGHTDPQVEPEVESGGGPTAVVFRVKPGPRTAVEAISVAAPPLPEGIKPPVLRLVPEAAYRVSDLAQDRAAVLAAWHAAGHAEAEVTPEVVFSPDHTRVTLTLRVTVGSPVRVDHVVVAGLMHTREAVVRRELHIGEGDPLSFDRLLESQRRVGSLDVVQRVSLAEMDPESPRARSLVVTVQEAPRTTVAYGLGYAERDLLRASAEVTRRNLWGMDRSVSGFARISFRGSRLLATFHEPYLFGHRQDLFVTAFREEEQRETFDFVRYGGVAQTARALGTRMSLILRYTYQQTSSFNVVDPDSVDREFSTAVVSGPSASLVRDTRDDPLDPHRGHFLSADVLVSHRLFGGESFGKGFLEAATYERLAPHLVLALAGRVGMARTFGFDEPLFLPRPDRFYAGGDYSLRGFPVDAVLPRGGNALLLGGAELRYDVGRYVSAAAFTDVGNVYPLVSDVSLTDLRYAAGLGLRYRSAFGPLRVDWGYKLNRRPGEGAYRFHFTVGHAF
jgi:outer membrane protein insertion porin family